MYKCHGCMYTHSTHMLSAVVTATYTGYSGSSVHVPYTAIPSYHPSGIYRSTAVTIVCGYYVQRAHAKQCHCISGEMPLNTCIHLHTMCKYKSYVVS